MVFSQTPFFFSESCSDFFRLFHILQPLWNWKFTGSNHKNINGLCITNEKSASRPALYNVFKITFLNNVFKKDAETFY